MNTITSKLTICGLAFLLTLISGVILSRLGKPLNSGVFTVHKLVAIGTLIVMGMSIYQLHQAGGLHTTHLITLTVTGLLFVVLIISGALLSLAFSAQVSLDGSLVQTAARVHQIVPLLTVVAASVSLYLLVSASRALETGLLQ